MKFSRLMSVYFYCCLLLSCDLFSNLPENDVEKIIDSKVAWANAPAAVVSIGTIAGSVNTVTLELGEVKQGYPFTLAFTPNPQWMFDGWEAVLTEDLPSYLAGSRPQQIEKTGVAMPLVEIVHKRDQAGNRAGDAEVTVYSGKSLTLIPHCVERPQITASNISGYFTPRKVTNYPIIITFNRPIHDDCLTFENFVISAKTNQGMGVILEGEAITRYFNTPVQNDSTVLITRNYQASDSEFVNLDITVKLQDIFDRDEIFMAGAEQLIYGVHYRSYTTPPETENMEAAAGKDNVLFSGDTLLPSNELPPSDEYTIPLENGERVVYFLLDADTLDLSINREYSEFANFRITEKREGQSYASESEYPYAEYLPAIADAAYAPLVTQYQAKHGGRAPYIIRHVLKTPLDGTIQLALQPSDDLGNRDSFGAAQKVRFVLNANPAQGARQPVITEHPEGGAYKSGAAISLSVGASAGDGGTLSWQWYRNTSNSNSGGTAVAGATESVYSPVLNETGTFYFYVVVTNTKDSTTAQAVSESAAVRIMEDPGDLAVTINVGSMEEWDLLNEKAEVPANTPVTFSVNGEYTSYRWYLNGVLAGSGVTYQFNHNPGVYELVALVARDGEERSGRCRVSAIKGL